MVRKWLHSLAEFAGIASYYVDKMRVSHKTTDVVYRKFLSSMGYDVSDEKSCRREYEQELYSLYSTGLGYCYSVFVGECVKVKFWLPESEYVDTDVVFELVCESDGKVVSGVSPIIRKLKSRAKKVRFVNGVKFFEYDFRLWDILDDSDFVPDYYCIRAKYRDNVCESLLIVAPKRAYLPKKIEDGRKILGVGLQLYGLKSNRNFGIGDFGDLKKLLPTMAKCGCDLVGINPLGPMYAMGNKDVSPYRTLSREYVNYLYIDLRDVEDFKRSDAVQNLMKKPAFLKKLDALHNAKYIDYSMVFKVKLSILWLMYREFCNVEVAKNSVRAKKFVKFKESEGKALFNLCAYEVLLENREPNPKMWNEGLSDCESAEFGRWARKHKVKIDFYAYTHWIGAVQLCEIQDRAKKLGLGMGLYLDIPVGAASDGVEVWQNRQLFADGIDIGTPPDTIRPKGQTWGLCPPIPRCMQKNGYREFRAMLGKTMRYAGVVRLDHSFSLSRLFWVVGNDGAKSGVYVNYDFRDLVAILCLESYKNRCLVIGEDLGNAPAGFFSVMEKRAILGNRVLYRQLPKGKDVSFANLFPYYSLCQVGTHDQATSCGFWVNEDIEENQRCGLYPKREQYLANLGKRDKERHDFFKLFGDMGAFWRNNKLDVQKFLSGNGVPRGVEYSFNICGAKTNSAIYLVRADDVYAEVKMQNVPGTVDEYPDWRIRFPVDVDSMIGDGKFADFFWVLRKYRR